MNSQTPTARLVKIIRRNKTVRVRNVIKHNAEFTESPLPAEYLITRVASRQKIMQPGPT